MASDSVLLINDMILPESRVPAFAATLDLIMLGACGSRERTLKEVKKLLGEVGLAVKESAVYHSELCHGIISAVLA